MAQQESILRTWEKGNGVTEYRNDLDLFYNGAQINGSGTGGVYAFQRLDDFKKKQFIALYVL